MITYVSLKGNKHPYQSSLDCLGKLEILKDKNPSYLELYKPSISWGVDLFSLIWSKNFIIKTRPYTIMGEAGGVNS